MGTKMNRGAFQRLVDENIEWLLEQQRSLERDHIKVILDVITDLQYPKEKLYTEEQAIDRILTMMDKANIGFMTELGYQAYLTPDQVRNKLNE